MRAVTALTRCWAVVLLLIGLTSCQGGGPPPESEFVNWPASLNDFRFRWTAERGVDLVSGPAVPLRAYLESYRVAQFTADIDETYPGFDRAVPALPLPHADAPAQLEVVRPAPDAEPFGPPGPFYGNEFFHVLELTPTDGGFRAYVCDGVYQIFRAGEQPGRYVSVTDYDSRTGINHVQGVKVWRVELSDSPAATDAPAVASAPQRGPNPAPVGDVFGPWRVTGGSDFNWGTPIVNESVPFSESAGVQRISLCSDRMPQWRTERDAIMNRVLDTPPTAEPADPGWPASRE